MIVDVCLINRKLLIRRLIDSIYIIWMSYCVYYGRGQWQLCLCSKRIVTVVVAMKETLQIAPNP